MHVFGTELIRSLAIWLAESRDYHLYIYKHGPAATDSYCDVTMAHCSHGYLWTHDIEVGASWRDCDNPELFGTWLHHFAYRGRMIHYGTLGDQTIYTRFGLICFFTLLIIFGLPCFNTGHRWYVLICNRKKCFQHHYVKFTFHVYCFLMWHAFLLSTT